MKKLTLITILLLLFTVIKANESNLFSVDNAKIKTEMTSLANLENYVENNQGVEYQDVQTLNNSLLENVLPIEQSPLSQNSTLKKRGDSPLGIPSFVWGLCLGIPGIAVVYFVADDKDETMSAFWGCVVSSAVGGVIYLIYFFAVLSVATSTI